MGAAAMTAKTIIPASAGQLRIKGNLPGSPQPLAPVLPVHVLAGRVTELLEWVYRIPACRISKPRDLARLPQADAPQITELKRILTEKATPEQAQALAVILLDSRGRAAGDNAGVMIGAMVHVVTANGPRRPPISAEVMAAGIERLWFKKKATPYNGEIGELRAACDTIREYIVETLDHLKLVVEHREQLSQGKRPTYEIIDRMYPLEDRDDDEPRESGPAW
jgi:hypothetical protein